MTPKVPRPKLIAGLSAGVAALALGGLVTQQALTRSTIDAVAPEPGAAVSTATPLIGVTVGDYAKTRDLAVTLNGVDVTARAQVRDNTIMVRTPRLADGVHRVAVEYRTSNLLARSVRRSWHFETDTKAPRVAVSAPVAAELLNTNRVPFEGTAEPGARIELAWPGGSAVSSTNEAGHWGSSPSLPEGIHSVTVTAVDRAGNRRDAQRRIKIDTTPPKLTVTAPAARLTESAELIVEGTVPADNPVALRYGVNFNGQKRVVEQGSEALVADEYGTIYRYAAYGEPDPALTLSGRSFTIDAGDLPQGRNRVTVWARDPAGNLIDRAYTVFVDSSEVFGESEMVRGARGADVSRLQRRLAANRVYRGRPTGTYDQKTERAVTAYQRKRKLTPTGRIDQATLEAMAGRIVVNLEQRKLRLVRDGRVVKTYPVAIGAPAYPTPTGRYSVIDKQVDPAWFPPNSPWAEGLGPIPPGPGNPLGTRWIGTSAPAIGIHGTYASNSIGTAASHGCVRMHISDVEELFEEVTLGTVVEFKAA